MQVCQTLTLGFRAYHAAMTAAPGAEFFLPPPERGATVYEGKILNSEGHPQIRYDQAAFLREAATIPIDAWSAIYWSGALITLGDALSEHDYFDHAPVLEMIYHLRNAVAHGNRFNVGDSQRFRMHPAHTRSTQLVRPGSDEPYVIDLSLNGMRCLFDFIDPAQLLGLLQFVTQHLGRLAGNPDGSTVPAPDAR